MHDILDWIRTSAIPMATVEAGNGFSDLEPLRRIIGNARIVSLGEATHGTREFFQLKHRLLEFCVSELDFTIFAIEASYPECLRINNYVLYGEGDPEAALAGTRFWTWDTEEVIFLIKWMREWNERHRRQIKFYGFDMQFPTEAALGVLDYLRRVAPELAEASEALLWPLSDDFSAERLHVLPATVCDAALAGIAHIREAFSRERSAWVAAAGELSWRLAQLELNVLDQSARQQLTIYQATSVSRDLSMAENVSALLELEGSQAKAVLWAHNGHVAREFIDSGKKPIHTMGGRLHQLFGDAQVVVGFAFSQGSFQAIRPEGGLVDHTVPPAPEGSFDRVFAAAHIPAFLLDLSTASVGPAVAWLASEPPSRCIGAVYSSDDERRYWQIIDPRRAYDVIAFVESTTAARPNATGRRPPAPKREPKSAARNMELAGGGDVPEGWEWSGGQRAHAYRIALLDESSPSRKRCVQIARPSAPWRWGVGRLEQTFSAAAWHGKRLSFTGFMRAEVQGPGAGARLYIELRPKPPAGSRWVMPVAAAAMSDRPVRSAQWVRYTAELVVSEEAHSIVIGLALAGDGSAWFGDLALSSA